MYAIDVENELMIHITQQVFKSTVYAQASGNSNYPWRSLELPNAAPPAAADARAE